MVAVVVNALLSMGCCGSWSNVVCRRGLEQSEYGVFWGKGRRCVCCFCRVLFEGLSCIVVWICGLAVWRCKVRREEGESQFWAATLKFTCLLSNTCF